MATQSGIPAAENGYGNRKGALHIWPRGEDVVIALPNHRQAYRDLILPYSNGEYCFDKHTYQNCAGDE
jgi:kynurenine 3-monooxygenase